MGVAGQEDLAEALASVVAVALRDQGAQFGLGGGEVFFAVERLGLVELRDDAQRVLEKNFPNSPYAANVGRPADKPWWKVW